MCLSKIWENFKFKIKIHSFKWEQKAVTIIFSFIIFASVIWWQFYLIIEEKINFPVNHRSHDAFCLYHILQEEVHSSYSAEMKAGWLSKNKPKGISSGLCVSPAYWMAWPKGFHANIAGNNMKLQARNDEGQKWRRWWFKMLR